VQFANTNFKKYLLTPEPKQVIVKPVNLPNILEICSVKSPFAPWNQDHGRQEGRSPTVFCFTELDGMFGAVGFERNIFSEYSHSLVFRDHQNLNTCCLFGSKKFKVSL
jgi:hypothetical protein